MDSTALVVLVLVAVGVVLICLGAWMSLHDWKEKRQKEEIQTEALADTLKGLAKLLEALVDYPTGQRLIVLGIVVLVIAGLFGAVSSL